MTHPSKTLMMNSEIRSVWIGFDPRESDGFAVTRFSIADHCNSPIPVRGLVLPVLQERGLYTRPVERRDGRLWDPISEAPMATEFACSRFLVPHLAKELPQYKGGHGMAVFMDSDMLVRTDIRRLERAIVGQPSWKSKAVWVVKHNHVPSETVKMDNQVQTKYSRKNWSSVMVFNVDHPANDRLTLDLVNSVPGRDLHAFCWLEDDQIGELGPEWNYLVGVNEPVEDPCIVHFTEGLPSMPGYSDQPYANEWRESLHAWAN